MYVLTLRDGSPVWRDQTVLVENDIVYSKTNGWVPLGSGDIRVITKSSVSENAAFRTLSFNFDKYMYYLNTSVIMRGQIPSGGVFPTEWEDITAVVELPAGTYYSGIDCISDKILFGAGGNIYEISPGLSPVNIYAAPGSITGAVIPVYYSDNLTLFISSSKYVVRYNGVDTEYTFPLISTYQLVGYVNNKGVIIIPEGIIIVYKQNSLSSGLFGFIFIDNTGVPHVLDSLSVGNVNIAAYCVYDPDELGPYNSYMYNPAPPPFGSSQTLTPPVSGDVTMGIITPGLKTAPVYPYGFISSKSTQSGNILRYYWRENGSWQSSGDVLDYNGRFIQENPTLMYYPLIDRILYQDKIQSSTTYTINAIPLKTYESKRVPDLTNIEVNSDLSSLGTFRGLWVKSW